MKKDNSVNKENDLWVKILCVVLCSIAVCLIVHRATTPLPQPTVVQAEEQIVTEEWVVEIVSAEDGYRDYHVSMLETAQPRRSLVANGKEAYNQFAPLVGHTCKIQLYIKYNNDGSIKSFDIALLKVMN